jgi:hypothetical protein
MDAGLNAAMLEGVSGKIPLPDNIPMQLGDPVGMTLAQVVYPPRQLPVVPALRTSTEGKTVLDGLSNLYRYPCEPPSFPMRERGLILLSFISGGLYGIPVPVMSLAENMKHSRLQARGANFPDAH